jgi:cell division protein FtsB
MKALIAILILLLLILQYKLWFGDGNMREVWRLEAAIEEQQKQNDKLRERNAALEAEVQDLKQGLEAIEERARNELGMIKKDETFYQIVEEDEVKKE